MKKRLLALFAGLLITAVGAEASLEKGPYLQQVRQDRMTVCMEGGLFDNVSGSVEWGTDPSNLSNTASASGRGRRHEIEITGLQPNTKYYYRGVFGDETTETFSFWTAPEPGTSFNFAVLGDNRTNHDAHRGVVEALMDNPITNTGNPADEIRLLVNTGDLVNLGILESDWDIFFEVENPMLNYIPILPAFGNHELGGDATWSRLWVLGNESPSEKYYSYQYGSVMFLFIDSNSLALDRNQRNWLQDAANAAANNPEINHIVGVLHHPVWGTSKWGRNESSSPIVEDTLEPLGCKLVLTGHDHIYQNCFVNDVRYMVIGGGGAPIYSKREEADYLTSSKEIYHYALANVTNERIEMSIHTVPNPDDPNFPNWVDPDDGVSKPVHTELDRFTVPSRRDTQPTPDPTPTPVAGDPTIDLTSPKVDYKAGEDVSWSMTITNPSGDTFNAEVYLVLELTGQYYFYNYNTLEFALSPNITSTPRTIEANSDETFEFLAIPGFPAIGAPVTLTWIGGIFDRDSGEFWDQFPTVSTTHP